MIFLKQSTAVNVKVGPFLNTSDGFTPATTLTITQPDIQLSKNGGTFAQKNAAQTLTHDVSGWYTVALDATDTGTLGALILQINESGALPVWREFMVIPANAYDGLVSGTGVGVRANVQGWNGTAVLVPGVAGTPDVNTKLAGGTAWESGSITAASVAASALNGKGDWNIGKTGYSLTQAFPSNFAQMSISVTTGLVDITQTAADKVWGTAARTLTAATNITSTGGTTVPQTGDTYALANGVNGFVAIDTVVDTINTNVGTAGNGLTNIGTIATVTNLTNAPTNGDLTAAMKTSINTEVVDALNVDTYAEPGQGTPAATTTLADKINYLYKNWRNRKTQTASTWSLMNDDATTVDQKSTVSDNGTTADKTEIVSGP